MIALEQAHSDNLRAGLLKLDHSGPTGFEGLVAVLLTNLLGQPFRLARAGSQRGRDGDSAFDAGETYFEAKRYENAVPPNEVKSKLIDLMNDDTGQLDLWVLGATTEIGAQTARDVRAAGSKIGISVVILDWSNTSFGSLITAIAATAERAKEFISENLKTEDQHLAGPASTAIDYFASHSELDQLRTALLSELSSGTSGLQHVKRQNEDWMRRRMGSKRLARAAFGQQLAPLADAGTLSFARADEVILRDAFAGPPRDELFIVAGREGVGKSWLVARAWLQSNPRPLLVICQAAELLANGGDFDRFLVEKLIAQTGEQPAEDVVKRWQRRVRGWRENSQPGHVRLAFVIDGLNETGAAEWGALIDQAAHVLSEIGGTLIVTTRTDHWRDVSSAVLTPARMIELDAWSQDEVSSILRSRSIEIAGLDSDLLRSLRNPRILGIAIDLLEANEIQLMGELSVGRLMFEHARKAASNGAALLSPPQFAVLLAKLGRTYLDRRQSQQTDDLLLFDANADRDLASVASSQFFIAAPGNSDLYAIRPDGLILSLALWLNETLERERRNSRKPIDELDRIIEPISALDETGSTVMLAAQVACLDSRTHRDVQSALVERFTGLQNVPQNAEQVFSALARSAPEAFLAAAEHAYTAPVNPRNVDWLINALIVQRQDAKVWSSISKWAQRWLQIYSLAPERMMFRSTNRDTPAEVGKERTRRTSEMAARLRSMTECEKTFVADRLVEFDRYEYDRLHHATFLLLAGKPLTEFAPSFVAWCVADSLAPSIHAADKQFLQLIRFNLVDWKETREALLAGIADFTSDATSNVGKWARVECLRATGDIQDAADAEELAEWLTRDRGNFPGWSLLEKYCPVDPCDPASVKPKEIDETAEQYRAINPGKLACDMGQGVEDRFFNMARAGVTRFRGEVALGTHRALADHVLTRQDFERRQGMVALLEHSSALNRKQAGVLLSYGQSSSASVKGERQERDAWITAQYSLLAAISHLTPDEQLETMVAVRTDTIFLDVVDAMRPASPAKVDEVLDRVLKGGDPIAQSNVLAALQHTRPRLSVRAKQIITQLIGSPETVARAQAMKIAANEKDSELLRAVVDSGWDARACKNKFEQWYGSSAILEAACAGLLTVDMALDRIAFAQYGFAAEKMGLHGSAEVASRVTAALMRAIGAKITAQPPDIAISATSFTGAKPPMVSLHARQSDKRQKGVEEQFDDLKETFDDRQKRIGNAFDRFSAELDAAGANLILADMTLEGIEALVEAAPSDAQDWLAALVGAPDHVVRHHHHFASELSVVFTRRGSELAMNFLPRLMELKPTVRMVHGLAEIPAIATLLWKNADNEIIRSICKKRLRACNTDSDLAAEVLAAFASGQQATVTHVIEELLSTGQPVNVCRALMISGYADVNPHSEQVLARFSSTFGYVGMAARAAREAYNRNVWAREWYRQMSIASTPASFWQASVLFTKIVDGRLSVWESGERAPSEVFLSFFPTVKRELKSRIEKWESKRAKLLFGEEIPDEMFLKTPAAGIYSA
ncbi:hypothetical protein [Rhizobium sp. 11_C7_N12_5]|uniref:hypothetical protein n=1 Tax=Rhizobium sp. 11_C7_N12_5 TaxID=3240770 RepID=UPI003F26AE4E